MTRAIFNQRAGAAGQFGRALVDDRGTSSHRVGPSWCVGGAGGSGALPENVNYASRAVC